MKENTRMIVGVLALIAGVLLGVQAVAVRHWFDGTGTPYFIPALLLIIVGAIMCRSEIAVFSLYALVVVFLAIGYHVQPHVTSVEPLCIHEDNCGELPKLLQDTDVFCSPFLGCPFHFECVSHDTEIHRSDICFHCGRPFSQHYVALYTIQKWISMIMSDRAMAELDYI